MTLLISSGSTQFGPLESALHALQQKPEFSIQAVWLIDNEETAKAFCDHVPKIKAVLGRDDVMIATLQVSEDDAFEKIPEFMSQFVLRNSRETNDVVVDLTAGPKFITSLLYAAANFCRIRHIYYFLLKGDKRNVPFAVLDKQDYEYLCLPPFSSESLDRLGRRSYLELISYLKEVEDLVAAYNQGAPKLAQSIDSNLRTAVRDYFEGDYVGSVRSSGGLLETCAERLYGFWHTAGLLVQYPPEKADKRGKPGQWAYHTSEMTGLFRAVKQAKEGELLVGFDEPFMKEVFRIGTVNDLLESARVLRNLAAHKANPLCELTRRDAKLMLDIAFNAIDKCRGTRFLLEEEVA